ncbi:hypothetical protein LXL04_024976 [Taraxacum kok-saghyz]
MSYLIEVMVKMGFSRLGCFWIRVALCYVIDQIRGAPTQKVKNRERRCFYRRSCRHAGGTILSCCLHMVSPEDESHLLLNWTRE